MKLLFVSTPVGPLGSGWGGGVELVIQNMVKEMRRRGHGVDILAPAGSRLEKQTIIEIPGEPQTPQQTMERTAPVEMPENSVLANMWQHAYRVQSNYDLLVNFAYDWLPYFLTPLFARPLAHFLSMGSLTDVMDLAIEDVVTHFPGSVSVQTKAQRDTFQFPGRFFQVGAGIDLSLYDFNPQPDRGLAYVGRIAPEKGLEDVLAAARRLQIPVDVMGRIQDQVYWAEIRAQFSDVQVHYLGFLPTPELQKALGRCLALLLTSRWVEAFGYVAIEALACGVPIIAYRRGGPAEIVEDGQTGFLIEPGNISELVAAVKRVDRIDRAYCRQQAEAGYSRGAFGDRVITWFREVSGNATIPHRDPLNA